MFPLYTVYQSTFDTCLQPLKVEKCFTDVQALREKMDIGGGSGGGGGGGGGRLTDISSGYKVMLHLKSFEN